MMMVSVEEKRWIVVGIAMNKVAAPVLRDAVKQGMDTNYANLDRHCQLLHPSCTLKTLTHGVVQTDRILKVLKFQNINNNHLHGKRYGGYNYSINDSVDLAKLYLPGYLAQFSGFDDSLDMTAILRLLGVRDYMQLPAAVFSRHTQTSADDVRENVRNKWGHVDVTEWTDAFFNDCFDKLKTLVRSLGLTTVVEKNTLDQLADWQTKGCHLVMGHAVDKELQQEVRVLIKNIRSRMRLKNKKICEIEEDVAILKDESSCKRARLDTHDEHLYAVEEKVQEVLKSSSGEIEKVLERLVSFEGLLSKRIVAVEEGLAKTDGRVEIMEQSQTKVAGEVDLLKQRHTETLGKVDQLEQSQTREVERLKQSNIKTVGEVEMLKQNHSEAVAKVDQLEQRCAKTDGKVEQMELDVKNWMTQTGKPEASCTKSFDLNSCRSKLEDHYLKTATVPTSVWSKKSVVDIHQIYTRLSWVKEEQTPTGTTQSELKHYTELFTANKDGVIQKRILVQGQTGIGKSTFVKKLLVDWVGVNKGTGDEQAAVLKNFELVVAVNLKEVSKFQSLTDVITQSTVFAKEDKFMTEGLVDYITNNQEKVLLIFDGYDEYRCGRHSEIYEIFKGDSLRSCSVLITTRISKADELRGGEDLQAEIIGFSEVDRKCFMRRFLNSEEVSKLEYHLYERQLQELAKVPLLLLFFCILWRKGQSKSFPKSKTTLYMDIIQFILNHSHSKQTASKIKKAPQYVELKSFKEMLSEIGKVALQGLLKDDHLFEYSQLSDSVRCDESVFIGLLQITEYSETSQPVGMVSFIHKSIQEFLAAWYITYRCIPKGGNLGEIGLKLEECMALKNVFEFICGLSEEGAFATFRHLKSVRISDPSLDLSKTVPDVKSETDMPLSDVTDRHWQFSDLVLHLFERVESKADLSRPCLDCLGSVLLCSERSLPKDLLLRTKEANPLSLVCGKTRFSYINSMKDSVLTLNKVVKMLVTDSSEIPNVAEFLEKFLSIRNCDECGFFSVLCFRDGQVYLYITHLRLSCKDHVRLFSSNVVPSHALQSYSGQLFLKFLKTLECPTFRFSMKGLGEVIKHCNHVERVEISSQDNSLHYLLEQVPNPRNCSLSIKFSELSSIAAVRKLASLLPRFETVTHLDLNLAKCSAKVATHLIAAINHKTLEELNLRGLRLTRAGAGNSLSELSTLRILKISCMPDFAEEALTRLLAAIKHKTLEELVLSDINLTSAVVEALCQSLPKLSALKTLWIMGRCSGCRLHLMIEFEIRNGSLSTLTISGWNENSDEAVTRLIDVIKHKTSDELELSEINLKSSVAESLTQLLPELSVLRWLEISCLPDCSDETLTRLLAAIKHKTLEALVLSDINLTSAVVEALCQSLPELAALELLEISGWCAGCRLRLEIESEIFSSPLPTLKISGWNECFDEAVTRLIDAIKHKTPDVLELSEVNLKLSVAESLSQLLPELSTVQTLRINGLTECSEEAGTKLVDAIKHKTLKELELSEIHLTSAVAEALGQSLPELSALRTLKINGLTECSEEAVTKLVAAVKHKTLTELELSEINWTSVAAEALGQSLPELSALRTLKISGPFYKCRLQHKEVEALFGRFNRPSSINELWFTDFTARGSLAPLANNLRFFPRLITLHLENLDMGEADLSGLLENLKFTPDLESLHVRGNPLGHAVRSMIPYLLKQQKLKVVYFRRRDCSEEDLKYVEESVKEKRPPLKIFAW